MKHPQHDHLALSYHVRHRWTRLPIIERLGCGWVGGLMNNVATRSLLRLRPETSCILPQPLYNAH